MKKQYRNVTKSQQGSAYLMVLFVSLLLFVMVSLVLAITAVSRRTTARYDNFVGLFDLGVASMEQVLLVLWQGTEYNREIINQNATTRAIDEIIANPTSHLTYRNRQFYLDSQLFMYKFVAEAGIILSNHLGQYFSPVGNEFRYNWDFGVRFSYETYESTINIIGRTDTWLIDRGFRVVTNVRRNNNGVLGVQTRISASIIWQDSEHEEIFHPQFTWQQYPSRFSVAIYQTENISILVNQEILPYLQGLQNNYNSSLIITNATNLDISNFTSYVAIIHTGTHLYLEGGTLYGIVVSMGTVELSNINIIGSIFANTIYIGSNVFATAQPYVIFEINLTPMAQQYFFDFLRISNFIYGNDIADVLGFLAISNGTIEVNCLDDYSLAMVELLRIAD